MGFSGDLDSVSLADVFQTLTQNQQTGTLRVADEETEKYIFFSQGAIRSVSSGRRRNAPLGELLLARNKITSEQLRAALDEQEGRQDDALLGETLVRQGACRQEDIDTVLRFQMEEEIYGLFTWKGAHFEFSEGGMETSIFGRRHRVSEIRINTAGLVMEAARRIDEWDRIREVIPSMHMVFARGPRFAEVRATIEDADEAAILDAIDGRRTVNAIVRETLLGQYRVTQTLAQRVGDQALREATAEEMRVAAEQVLLAGDPEGAIGIYERLLEIEGENPEVRRHLASAEEAAGRLEDAARSFRILGRFLSDTGEFQPAIEALERAGRLTTLSGEDMDRLAELYLVVNRDRDAASLWLTRVRTLLDRKDLGRAAAVCDRALEHAPEAEELRSLRARIALEEGDHKGAITAYEALAAQQLKRGNLNATMSTYRSILHLDPSRSDLRERIKSMQTRTARRRSEGHYRLAIYATLALVALGLLLGVGAELSARFRLDRRRELARDLRRRALAAEDLAEQERLLEELVAAWASFSPGFALTDVQGQADREREEAEALLARTRDQKSREAADTEAADARRFAEARTLLKTGEEESRTQALGILETLSSRRPPNAWTDAAADLRRRVIEERNAAKALYEQSRQPGRSDTDRFADLKTLVERYPDSVYARRARLPVRVRIDPPLPAVIRLDETVVGHTTADRPSLLVELPPFDPFVLKVERPGFGADGVTILREQAVRDSDLLVRLERSVRWRRDEAIAGGAAAAPVIAPARDNRPAVFVAGLAGNAAAYDLDTGRPAWHFRGGKEGWSFRTPPHVEDGKLYLLDAAEGRLLCLDAASGNRVYPADGERNGHTTTLTGAAVFARLRFYNNELFCIASTHDGRIVCLRAEDGSSRWTEPYATGRRASLRAAGTVHGDFVYWPVPDGTVHVLRGDGEAIGRLETAFRTPGSLAVVEGRLLAAGARGGVAAWKTGAEDPEPLWQSGAPAESVDVPLLATKDRALLATVRGRLLALAPADGDVLWETTEAPGAIRIPMALLGDRLYAAADRNVCCFDAATGALRWSHRPGDRPLAGLAAGAGSVVALDADGGLVVYTPDRDPQAPASRP
ncbi:MAG: DUF4388 domain-containing protein [Planctomycetota bacterium]